MICQNCQKEYSPPKHRGARSKFCCKECRNEWKRKKPKRFTKICEFCGTEFETNSQTQKYCSTKCAHAACKTGRTVFTKICLYCGKEFETIYKDHKYCSSTCAARHAADQRRGEYFCEYCGKPRRSDHPSRNRFCSRDCAVKYRMIRYLPVKQKKEQEIKEKREAELHRVCPECGEWFQASSFNQCYCSPQCQYKHSLEESHNSYVRSYQPHTFICQECGKTVTTSPNDTRQNFCSEECCNKNWKRIYKRNREKQVRRVFVEVVNLWTVYDRAQGKCAICDLPVPRQNDPANVWSPTVDHIVPLSIGGLHSYENCQLSHRLCNCFKGQETRFKIDWKQKLADEPGQWNERLDDLWTQLGQEIDRVV